MSKYSTEFKLQVVNEYLKSGGQKRVAHLFGIGHSDVRKWYLAYQAHGLIGLNPGPQAHTAQFKMQVLQYMATHHLSARSAAAHFNIASPSTIWVWQKLYNKDGVAALKPKPTGRPLKFKPSNIKALLAMPLTELTHDELLCRAQYLEVENAYLKKLEALAQQKHLANKSKSK